MSAGLEFENDEGEILRKNRLKIGWHKIILDELLPQDFLSRRKIHLKNSSLEGKFTRKFKANQASKNF